MSSVWGGNCQKCKQEKSKVILSLKIILFDISDTVGEYLPCNDCSKMIEVLDDPIYKTLSEEQKMIFKFVKLFPFPKTIKAIKEEFFGMAYATVHFEAVSLYMVNKGVFSILKYIYENLYMDWEEETVKELVWSVKMEWYKRDPDYSYFIAYDYIFDVITNLMIIYVVKSRWGTNIDWSYPSYHKHIQFAMGNDDVSSLRRVINKRLNKNNTFRFRD